VTSLIAPRTKSAIFLSNFSDRRMTKKMPRRPPPARFFEVARLIAGDPAPLWLTKYLFECGFNLAFRIPLDAVWPIRDADALCAQRALSK